MADFLGAGPEAERLAQWHMAAWSNFARVGDPGTAFAHGAAGAPGPWPRYDTPRRATMILDAACGVADDPLAVIADRVGRLVVSRLPGPLNGGRVTP